MSPLRKWMAEHGRPSWYSWVVVVGTSVLSSTLAIVVGIESAQRAVDAERSARLQSEQALCSLVVVLDRAYKGTPPTTPTGKEVAEGMAGLRATLQCPPPIPPKE